MYGAGIGSLNVYASPQNVVYNASAPIWSRSHDQGNQWRQAAVTIQLTSNYQIYFEGMVGSSYTGDIGLDDLSLATGPCVNANGCDFQTGI